MKKVKVKPKQFIASQTFEIDAREEPSRFDRQFFLAGWRHANQGRPYTEDQMKNLSWQNLGYRLGLEFGEYTRDGIHKVFKKFHKHWKKTNKRNKFVIFG